MFIFKIADSSHTSQILFPQLSTDEINIHHYIRMQHIKNEYGE